MSMQSDEFTGTYQRVLPRDAFNEGNLMTNIGRLWIALSQTHGHDACIVEEDLEEFRIMQNEATGGLVVANLTFTIDGVPHRLERPLNSRDRWPLMVSEKQDDDDFDPVSVFDDDGRLSLDMLRLIGADGQDREPGRNHSDLIDRLKDLARKRAYEQGLSRHKHPDALAVSITGEHRVNRQIADLLPEILSTLGHEDP